MTEKKQNSIKIWLAILKFSVLVVIIVGLPLLIYFRYPEIIQDFRSLESINKLLDDYHTQSIFIYVALQFVQVIIAFLPGQAIQFASGYAFSVPLGLLLSLIGISLGTAGTFYLGKLFGKDIVYIVFGDERLKRFITLLNSKKAFVAVFLLYLFPGIPKDVFSYAAGVSEMRVLPFLITSLVGRTPALLMTILVGNMFRSGSYVGIVIVSVIVLSIALMGIIKRKKVYGFIDKIYYKFINKDEKPEDIITDE